MRDYTFNSALRNGIKPSHKRNKALRAAVDQVIVGKPSQHSSSGTTVAFILSELERRGQPYVLLGMPGQGYVIKAAAKIGETIEADLTATSE